MLNAGTAPVVLVLPVLWLPPSGPAEKLNVGADPPVMRHMHLNVGYMVFEGCFRVTQLHYNNASGFPLFYPIKFPDFSLIS